MASSTLRWILRSSPAGISVAVVTALSVSPSTAASNASQWASTLGLDVLARWLDFPGADLALLSIGIASLIVWSIYAALVWYTPRLVRTSILACADHKVLEPDYAQWDKSEVLTLWNAAHLWAEQEPIIDHPGGPPPFYEIFTNLKAASDGNLLPVHLGGGQYGHTDKPANRYTVAHRDDLRRFAREHRKERPKFLFPEWRLTRQEAIDILARKMEEFLDNHFNKRPQTAIDQEDWWGVFLTWRNSEIRPLVERLNGEAAAANFSTFVSFDSKIWDPYLGPRFNHIKTMMEITLHRIKKIIEEFRP